MTPGRVRIAAHAKVNLFLRILAREASGFHAIETLFALLELADDLTVELLPQGIELTVEGGDTGPEEQNLVTRAARMVLEATGNRGGVRMHLVKRIPVRAGLGGGSSDGAAALHAVNFLLGNPIPRHEILQLATRLGSDVAFFASSAPLALAWGHGERLFRLPSPGIAPALIALPPFGISTPEAYILIDRARSTDPSRGATVFEAGAFDTWSNIGRLGGNDFESVVFGKEPRLKDLFTRVAETRPLLVRMSGSGSAVVALYQTEMERNQAAATLGERGQLLIRTSTRSTGPEGPARVEA